MCPCRNNKFVAGMFLVTILIMKLNEELVKKLSKTYEPSTMINMRFREIDIAFKTDEGGNPILLFIGKLTEVGTIKGERYARRLAYDREGNVIKDHWELKGKAT
jgi:hypothetical protein